MALSIISQARYHVDTIDQCQTGQSYGTTCLVSDRNSDCQVISSLDRNEARNRSRFQESGKISVNNGGGLVRYTYPSSTANVATARDKCCLIALLTARFASDTCHAPVFTRNVDEPKSYTILFAPVTEFPWLSMVKINRTALSTCSRSSCCLIASKIVMVFGPEYGSMFLFFSKF